MNLNDEKTSEGIWKDIINWEEIGHIPRWI